MSSSSSPGNEKQQIGLLGVLQLAPEQPKQQVFLLEYQQLI
jgi:hypothetical protein